MYLGLGITEEEHRAADIAIRKQQLELRRLELEAARKSDFWSTARSVATVAIPVITLLGIAGWFKIGGRRR